MISQADLDVFLARVRRHGGRMSQLAERPAQDAQEALLAALTELETMYEDLLVADEELRVQSEHLRASQAALAATRSRYLDLFAAAPVGYLVTTAEGIILESNRVAADLLGNPPRGGVGKPVQAYVDMSCRAELRRLMLSIWRDGGAAVTDVVLRPRAGRRLDVVLTVARAIDTQGGGHTLRFGLTPPGGSGTGMPAADGEVAWPAADRGAGRDAVPRDPVPRDPVQLDRLLLDALFGEASIGLLVLDADLRVQRASTALTGGLPATGSSLEALLLYGGDAVGQLALACMATGEPMRAEIDGRTAAEPGRERRWKASARPLVGVDGGVAAVGCLLVDQAAPQPSAKKPAPKNRHGE
jgi:PAS domain-containing protein